MGGDYAQNGTITINYNIYPISIPKFTCYSNTLEKDVYYEDAYYACFAI
jgi:hypothetical protein